tara:strand:- start:1865 stop:2446 length:582 start_codon:yes stop_codon:yes gene_type:complete
MNILEKLQKQFPQIKVTSEISNNSNENPAITYSCAFHGGEKTAKLKQLQKKKSCCPKCSNLLNKGHTFNLDGNPLAAKKIQELLVMFGDRFDYSYFKATDTQTPSTIMCKKHGAFTMSLHDHVLSKEQLGCSSCIAESEGTVLQSVAKSEKAILANSLAKIEVEKRTSIKPTRRAVSADWLEKAKSMFGSLAT